MCPRRTWCRGISACSAAGDIIPGDAAILESKDLFVQEAALTGESFPAEKATGMVAKDASLMKRTNALFMGTHVVSGNAHALIVLTGASTEFGKVSERLRMKPAETEFERGVRRFGYLLTEVTLILVVVIFGITVYLQRPVIDSFRLALAIAVGIIPELLPAIISINLAPHCLSCSPSDANIKAVFPSSFFTFKSALAISIALTISSCPNNEVRPRLHRQDASFQTG